MRVRKRIYARRPSVSAVAWCTETNRVRVVLSIHPDQRKCSNKGFVGARDPQAWFCLTDLILEMFWWSLRKTCPRRRTASPNYWTSIWINSSRSLRMIQVSDSGVGQDCCFSHLRTKVKDQLVSNCESRPDVVWIPVLWSVGLSCVVKLGENLSVKFWFPMRPCSRTWHTWVWFLCRYSIANDAAVALFFSTPAGKLPWHQRSSQTSLLPHDVLLQHERIGTREASGIQHSRRPGRVVFLLQQTKENCPGGRKVASIGSPNHNLNCRHRFISSVELVSLQVLFDFPHTTPNIPLEYLFDLFPAMQPRAFSIASSLRVNWSSPSAIPLKLLLTEKEYLLHFEIPSRLIRTKCSSWWRLWITKRNCRNPGEVFVPRGYQASTLMKVVCPFMARALCVCIGIQQRDCSACSFFCTSKGKWFLQPYGHKNYLSCVLASW